jgi:hypothetical protein
LILAADIGQVADGGHVGDAGYVDNRVAQGGEARYGQFPGFLQQVETCDHERERGKADGEKDEGGQQFAHDVELRQRYDGQESPQPDASGVLELALHGSLLISFERRPGSGMSVRAAVLLTWWWPSNGALDDDVHFRSVKEKRQCTGGELGVDWR